MNKKGILAVALSLGVVAAMSMSVLATNAQLYFSSDKNGEHPVTKVQEGDEIWIVVDDPDEDSDCDVRDKVWTDVKVMDVKTGAHIVWRSYIDQNGIDADGDGAGDNIFHGDANYKPHKGHWPGPAAGWLGADYLEETDHGTGVFVSTRPFQIGTRKGFTNDGRDHSHIAGPYDGSGPNVVPTHFEWGNYLYAEAPADGNGCGDDRVWVNRAGGFELAQGANAIPTGVAYLPPGVGGANDRDYMLGRFENMDSLVGLYVDWDDPSDVALTVGKIDDTEATIEWNREIHRDPNEAATITVVDPDENLNCSKVEMVPVFVLVNPGSWNALQTPTSATDFCTLKRYGGVIDLAGNVDPEAIVWHNIYDSGHFVNLAADGSNQPNQQGTYYVHYPTVSDSNVTSYDTASNSGIARVMFYAEETGSDTGVFQVRFNSILRDLGFRSLDVRDVLTAYYIDPNDQDDFKLAVSYIERHQHSRLRFTGDAREGESVFWIGRSPVYIEVVDANANEDGCCPEEVLVQVCDPHEVDDVEWLLLNEISSSSPIFFTHVGMKLVSVWDALGVGDPAAHGGYSLQLDNWELEAFNEDSIYARYNDVTYREGDIAALGDANMSTPGASFPPRIETVRVANDVSFSVFEVGDTQVSDGEETSMFFLDRAGNVVTGYSNSGCVFVKVIDPDQDEDRYRRERIDGYWDGGQNVPFGPQALNPFACQVVDRYEHTVNPILGDTDIYNASPAGSLDGLGYRMPTGPDEVVGNAGWPNVYVLNPRNGRWTSIDLLETGMDTGEFVSVSCIDLVSQYECAPSLAVLPGDTLLAAYQDPSNHSDIAWISIRVGIGGGVVTGSATSFVDDEGSEVAAYVVGDPIYVKVVDPSLAGLGAIRGAVTIDGATYDLAPLAGAGSDAFITSGLDLGCAAGDTVTATYVDPFDSDDSSSDTVTIAAVELDVERFFSTPNPFTDDATFGYLGAGLADTLSVAVYDLAGHNVWAAEAHDALAIDWEGRNERGERLANGGYIYVVVATGNGKTFTGKGTLFIHR